MKVTLWWRHQPAVDECKQEAISLSQEIIWLRIKWQSSSMCLVRSWKIGLVAMCIAVVLSQNTKAGLGDSTWRSESNWRNQSNSLVVAANALYVFGLSRGEWYSSLFLGFPGDENHLKRYKIQWQAYENQHTKPNQHQKRLEVEMMWICAVEHLCLYIPSGRWRVIGWAKNWLKRWTTNEVMVEKH